MNEKIYKVLDKLTAKTPLTPLGWFILVLFIMTPIILGFSYVGYKVNSQLIELQSKTNGMEHTDNWHVLHFGENNE